jgi:hypothetical protein
MEQSLGKLTMDAAFRDAFFRDPLAASLAAGIQLTDQERNALGRIAPGALAAFRRYLDEKLIGVAARRQTVGTVPPSIMYSLP